MVKIKVRSEYSGVLPTGSYQNARPGFSAEIEVDLDEGKEIPKDAVDRLQKELQSVCYANFKKCEQQAIVEKIERERADFRWYPDDDGVLMPSSTSIIGFDSDMFVSPADLQQYASQSNICHAQVAHFIDTLKKSKNGKGDWVEAKDLSDVWADIVIVTKGNLGLSTNGWSFPDFLEKYPIKNLNNGKASVNLEHRYGGTPDFTGIPEFAGSKGFENVKPVETLWDVKRTADKVKNFKQMASYVNLRAYKHIKQIGIVPLNNKTQQGYSKPIITDKVDEYFKMFLRDREAFKKRFQV